MIEHWYTSICRKQQKRLFLHVKYIEQQNCNRSEKYLEVKDDVVGLISEYAKIKSGKAKVYVKQLRKYVENRDSSFEMNLKTALLDCKNIMAPFVKCKYNGAYESIVDGLCLRMGYYAQWNCA